jgi:hypothetical protein
MVSPGEVATFIFSIRVPTRRTIEHFQLVADGITWLPNTGFMVSTPVALRHPVQALQSTKKVPPRMLLDVMISRFKANPDKHRKKP